MSRKMGSIDLQKNDFQNARAHYLAAAPSSPADGQQYHNSTDHTTYIYDSGAAGWYSTRGAAVSYGTPGSSAVGDAAAAGSATTVARSDHVHGREGFGTVVSNTTFGLAAANGTATTVSRSDHSHGSPAAPTAASTGAVANAGNVTSARADTAANKPAGNAYTGFYQDTTNNALSYSNGTTFTDIVKQGTGIVTQAIGDTAAAGTNNGSFASADHRHGMPAFGAVVTETAYGQASANGSATTVARSDHTHGTQPLTAVAPTTAAVGDAAAVGTGTAPAREDHRHGMPAFGAVTAQTAFGASSANGSAATIARSDHAHGTPTHIGTDHAAISISSLAAPTGDVSWASHKITNLLDPTSAQDAATKNYVDSLSAGIAWKDSVATVYTTNVAGTYANGASGVGATITEASNGALGANDGYTPVAGDRVLLTGQTTAANNGIYVVTNAGSAGAPYVLTRATDNDSDTDIRGTMVSVDNGTTNGGTVWHLNTTGAITVGTTSLSFGIWTGATAATAGAGLTATGNVFAVGAGAGIVVNADSVTVDRATNGQKVGFIYAQTIGDGAASSFTITHNLGSTDVIPRIYNISTGAEEDYDVTHTSTTQITVAFPFVPASNSYRVVVLG